jgi:hypothetical protein
MVENRPTGFLMYWVRGKLNSERLRASQNKVDEEISLHSHRGLELNSIGGLPHTCGGDEGIGLGTEGG